MTNGDDSVVVDVFLKEYERLKAEQTQRIGFRDNLPWVCIILGWTYVVNDEKISAIGKYIRINLTKKVCALTGSAETDALFGWEVFHRDDQARIRRKWQQWVVDEITFVISGYIALAAFVLTSAPSGAIWALCGTEALLLFVLAVEMYGYADFAKGR